MKFPWTKQKTKSVCDRIKCFSDVLRENAITPDEFKRSLSGLSSDEIGYRKVKLIVNAYNEGKKIYLSDNSPGFYPIFSRKNYYGSLQSAVAAVIWSSFSGVSPNLCFLDRTHAVDAGNKFLNEFAEFYTVDSTNNIQAPIK